MDLPQDPGVYRIMFPDRNDYLSFAPNFRVRWEYHVTTWKLGKHFSAMQEAYDKYTLVNIRLFWWHCQCNKSADLLGNLFRLGWGKLNSPGDTKRPDWAGGNGFYKHMVGTLK